jgi:hypothetical protein
MAAPLKVRTVTLLDDTLVNPIDPQTTIIGMVPRPLPGRPLRGVQKLNVRIELDGEEVDTEDAPAQLDFTVMTFEPRHRRGNKGSMSRPLKTSAPRDGSTFTYAASVPLSTLAPFMKSADGMREVATVIREGGTSAPKFRQPLLDAGWALRGATMQRRHPPSHTEHDPDPLLLFQSGGVEVLEVAVAPGQGLRTGPAARAWAFVRSPADVLFYSGHGAWDTCNLSWFLGGDREDPDNWEKFLGSDDLIDFWSKQGPDIQRSPMDLDILIINGCSVLRWSSPNDPCVATDPLALDPEEGHAPCGPRWQRLLCSRDGPLYAILGYRDLAPLDSAGGDAVAERMGRAMAPLDPEQQWDKFAPLWMKVNQQHGPSTWTAAAIDLKGYWYMNKKEIRSSHPPFEIRPLRGGCFLEKDSLGKSVKEGDVLLRPGGDGAPVVVIPR